LLNRRIRQLRDLGSTAAGFPRRQPSRSGNSRNISEITTANLKHSGLFARIAAKCGHTRTWLEIRAIEKRWSKG
jgi:hypothetical protein